MKSFTHSNLFILILVIAFAVLQSCTPYQKALRAYDGHIPENEIRALWIVRDQLVSRSRIQAIVAFMHKWGFNTAIVQVRGRGDAWYRSDFVMRAAELPDGLDPLAEFIRAAHPRGITVHAWINVFFAASPEQAANPPANHLAARHPDWFLKDKSGRSMLSYTVAEIEQAQTEGAFLDPALPAVQKYNLRVSQEILTRYKVDGLHLDFIRYPWSRPGTNYDYGRDTIIKQQAASNIVLNAESLNELRRKAVSDMVRAYYQQIRRLNPKLILSAAVWPNYQKSYHQIFQDFTGWIRGGYLDYAYLMAYYTSETVHDSRMEAFYDPLINSHFIIGSGLYLMPDPEVVVHQIRSARAIGAAGVSIFRAREIVDGARHGIMARYRLVDLLP
ncbi:MAG: family 10 glycosylhydrolase [Leptospiraceae bacterium]|nr:family 10 glycosylhydrolase [Leptospiraceae bacterium]